MPEIRIENLSFTYKGKNNSSCIFDNASLVFPSDTINVILGESGSGKTTLLRCILGALKYEGNIYIDNKLTDEMSTNEMMISYMSQEYNLYPHMTIFDNIAFPLKIINASRNEIEQRVYEIADDLGIRVCLSRKPKQVSGGQQQRTALARSLIKKPKILLLDEPLSNVDTQVSFSILDELKKLQTQYRILIIYVTHSKKEAEYIADNIYEIKNGKIKKIKKTKK